MNVCITCSTLRNYAGSERIVYEYTKVLTKLGHDVIIACIDIGDFYFNEMEGVHITDQLDLLKDEFDLILTLHWPSFFFFFRHKIRAKKIVYVSLSPFEPIEIPIQASCYFDLIICNSEETKNHLSQIVTNLPIDVFSNSVDSDIFVSLKEIKKLEKVAIVSNHPPDEILSLENMFQGDGIHCEVIGSKNCKFISPDVLKEYDLIITIGYTVVMCLAMKIPVYVYDHFGGDGWLTRKNITINKDFNYSGRPKRLKRTADELYRDIVENFESSKENLGFLYDIFYDNHELKSKMKELISDLSIRDYKDIYIRGDAYNASLSYVNLFKSFRNVEYLLSKKEKEYESLSFELKDIILNNEEEIYKLSNLSQVQCEYINELKFELSKEKEKSYVSKYLENSIVINNKYFGCVMSFFEKIKYKINIILFLFKRFMFQVKSRGFKYAFSLVVKKKNQALNMLFPRIIKNKHGNIDTVNVDNNNKSDLNIDFEKGLVSVIIPIYDRTWELREAIESILSQDYKNIELILITDGSPQDTMHVVNEYLDLNNVKIFNYPSSSGNAVRGRNKGIIEAKGEFIAFLDSDDIAFPNRISLSIDFLNQNKEYAGVYGTWVPLLDGSRPINGIENGKPVFSPDGSLREHIENCIPCQSTVLLRSSALKAVGGVNTNMHYREDHELWARLYANGYLLKSLTQPLVQLRLHQGNNELSFTYTDNHWYKELLEQYNTKILLPKKIVWVVAGLGISGGLAVILKHANNLLSKGHDVSLLTLSEGESISWYDNHVPVYELNNDKDYHLDNIDLLIATAWNTEPYLEQILAKRKMYFVQSDERRFIDNNEINKVIEAGYNKNYEYFTEAYWIQKMFHDEFNKQAFYVPNGIDTEIFNNDKLFEPKGNRKRVLIEGPIDIPFKAVEDCYNAVKDLDCEIWFVSSAGKPKDDWRYDKFFEKVPMNLMPSIYSSCDIFIKMSRIEGFFGPPLEAMACNCVPVVGKVSGWDEYIVDKYNALTVDLMDVEGAKNAVQKLLEDDDLAQKLLCNGHKTVSQWSWDRSFERMELLVSK